MWRMANFPIMLAIAIVCAGGGQLRPAAIAANDDSPESSPRSTDSLEKVRSEKADHREDIDVGDTVVITSPVAEVTDGKDVIARISKGVRFRVLRVTDDSVFGWIHIQGALDIVWLKRGHEAGWVRRDHVRLAGPGDLAVEEPPAVKKPAVSSKPENSHNESGKDNVQRDDVERRKRFTPETTEKPPPAAKTDNRGTSGRKSGSGYAGHFSCRTLVGKNRQLCAAVSEEDSAEVRRLLAEGADINARSEGSPTKGMTILQLAVWYEWDVKSIRLLLEAGADVDAKDERGNTALIYATSRRPAIDPEVVRILIDAGANVNARGAKGLTALMHASMHDAPEAIQMLIDAGADINTKDKTGWTPLMNATRRAYGYPCSIDLLIAAGAEVNATHNFAGTALGSAAYNGHVEAVKRLIRAGAKVNSADTGGWTPLICAATNGHVQIVKLLIEAGADVNTSDRLGRTPLSASSNESCTEAVELLTRAGAR